MSRQKDLKRLVRTRMQKTGESYTTARSHLLKKKTSAASLPADYRERAGMSDDAVQAKTGKTWPQWVQSLDAVGAGGMSHRDIARHLHQERGLPQWWAQTVTVGYERLRGLRDVGQRRGGAYEVSKSRTVGVALQKLYRAFSVKRTRQHWLPESSLKIRTSTVDKSMRITWHDGTDVDVAFYDKGNAKSQVVIQHRGLAGKRDMERMRAYWTERLAALATLL